MDAPLYGVADFHKNCHKEAQEPLALSGIPIYYHRCRDCGFLFTVAWDAWSPEDFARQIYNAEYLRVDPDYVERRPHFNAQMLAQLLGHAAGAADFWPHASGSMGFAVQTLMIRLSQSIKHAPKVSMTVW
jgi:hypothetical protein